MSAAAVRQSHPLPWPCRYHQPDSSSSEEELPEEDAFWYTTDSVTEKLPLLRGPLSSIILG